MADLIKLLAQNCFTKFNSLHLIRSLWVINILTLTEWLLLLLRGRRTVSKQTTFKLWKETDIQKVFFFFKLEIPSIFEQTLNTVHYYVLLTQCNLCTDAYNTLNFRPIAFCCLDIFIYKKTFKMQFMNTMTLYILFL